MIATLRGAFKFGVSLRARLGVPRWRPKVDLAAAVRRCASATLTLYFALSSQALLVEASDWSQ